MKPLRLLALHASDELYGSDRVFYDVMVGLDRSRFQPVAVLPRDVSGGGKLSRRLVAAGIEVRCRDMAVLRRRYLRPIGLTILLTRLAADVIELWRLMRRYGCDLVYTNTIAVQSGGLVARLTGRPHVWHVHEIIASPGPMSRLLRASLSRFSSEVIVVSEVVADWVGPLACPVTVVHNGIDEPRPSASERESLREHLLGGHGGPLVGWVSRISHWKGHEVFVEMADRMAALHPQAVFVLAGGPVPGQGELVTGLTRRLQRSPYADRIRYLGEVPDGPGLVACLDILVACPTRPDPFPRVVEEALWHGVPVVAVRTGGLSELVDDGCTGRLVPSADPVVLGDALEELFDPIRRASFSWHAQEAAATFSQQIFIEKISGIIERASARAQAQRSDRWQSSK